MSRGSNEKCLDSGYILKAEIIGLMNRQDVAYTETGLSPRCFV